MHRTILIFSVLFFLIPFSYFSASDILYRTPDNLESSVQAEFVLDSPVNDIWDILTDYKNSGTIMPNIEKTSILKKEKNNTIVKTTVKQGPFTMTYTSRLVEKISSYFITWNQIDGPFSKNSGSWKLIPLSEQSTRVIYTIQLDHPLMPGSVRKSLVKKSIPNMYEALKKELNL